MENNNTAKWLKRIFILFTFPVVIGSFLLSIAAFDEITWIMDSSGEQEIEMESTKVIVVKQNMMPGDTLSEYNVGVMSKSDANLPSAFIAPEDFWIITGHKITYPIKKKQPLTLFHTDIVSSENSEYFHDAMSKLDP